MGIVVFRLKGIVMSCKPTVQPLYLLAGTGDGSGAHLKRGLLCSALEQLVQGVVLAVALPVQLLVRSRQRPPLLSLLLRLALPALPLLLVL